MHHCPNFDLEEAPVSCIEKRQVFDAPPMQVEVFEHQAEIKQCPCYRKEVKASFPADVAQPVQYGNYLRAQVSYLNNYQLLPWQRTYDLIEDFYQHRPVQGLISSSNQQLGQRIDHGLAANPQPPQPAGKRGCKKQTPPKNLLDRLQKYKPETLAFMYDRQIPFDNNLAERDVRMAKVKQKVSGSFRALPGAETFCAIGFYITIVRKHGRNVIHEIYNAFNGNPFIPLFLDGQPE